MIWGINSGIFASLRELLETILPQNRSFDNYEVEHDFTTIGRRIMLLNARQFKEYREKIRHPSGHRRHYREKRVGKRGVDGKGCLN